MSKRRREWEAVSVNDLARAYEWIDWLKRLERSRNKRERARARLIRAKLDRLDREIALALTRRRG